MDKFSDLFEDWNDDFENRNELTTEEESSLMHNSFLIVTGRSTFAGLLGGGSLMGAAFIGGIMATLFNPTESDCDKEEAIDTLIEYYTKEEDYKKCAELVKLKNNGQN